VIVIPIGQSNLRLYHYYICDGAAHDGIIHQEHIFAFELQADGIEFLFPTTGSCETAGPDRPPEMPHGPATGYAACYSLWKRCQWAGSDRNKRSAFDFPNPSLYLGP